MFPLIKDLYRHPKVYQPEELIGIEIEMEGQNLNFPNNPGWFMKGDGSLRGDSMEYIIRGAKKPEDVPKYLDKLIRALMINNLERGVAPAVLTPSDRCGVHIHVNVQHNTFFEVFNFIFLYLMLEKVLVEYCGESRTGNLFCLRSSDAEYFIDKMIMCRKNSDFEHLFPGRDTLRYASVNPGAIYKFGSVEFRALRTPKDLTTIYEWVKILLRVKDASIQMLDDPADAIEGYSKYGEDRYFDLIMGDMAPVLRKKVKDIDQKMLDGMRLTQDIAYTDIETVPLTTADMGMKPPRLRRRGRIPPEAPRIRELEEQFEMEREDQLLNEPDEDFDDEE